MYKAVQDTRAMAPFHEQVKRTSYNYEKRKVICKKMKRTKQLS